MVARLPARLLEEDQHVVLRGMCWQDFEAMLALRGDRAGVRMYYLDGEIELMSPAKTHELRKKTLARLLEAWSDEVGLDLNGFGSWTLKKEVREAGGEPDECYILGLSTDADVPDLVIEVEWSRALGLAKQEIYRRLGVRELWTLRANRRLVVRVLEKGAWVERAKSKVLPKLDVAWLVSFLAVEPQSRAVRTLREAVRPPKRRR
jgi:Uma2 family endonuclease